MNSIDIVRRYFKSHYDVDIENLEITDVPGYWRDKEPMAHPGHPLHNCIGCSSPFRATYFYCDNPRDNKGRWASKFRTWRKIYSLKNRK